LEAVAVEITLATVVMVGRAEAQLEVMTVYLKQVVAQPAVKVMLAVTQTVALVLVMVVQVAEALVAVVLMVKAEVVDRGALV